MEVIVNVKLISEDAYGFIDDVLQGRNEIIGKELTNFVFKELMAYLNGLGEDTIKSMCGENSNLTWILIGMLRMGKAVVCVSGAMLSMFLEALIRLLFVETNNSELLVKIVEMYFADTIVDQIVQSCIESTKETEYAVENIDYDIIKKSTGSDNGAIVCEIGLQVKEVNFKLLGNYIEEMKAQVEQWSKQRETEVKLKRQEDKEKVEEYKKKSCVMGLVATVGAFFNDKGRNAKNSFVEKITSLGSGTQSVLVEAANKILEKQMSIESAVKASLVNKLIDKFVNESFMVDFLKDEFKIEEKKLKVLIKVDRD